MRDKQNKNDSIYEDGYSGAQLERIQGHDGALHPYRSAPDGREPQVDEPKEKGEGVPVGGRKAAVLLPAAGVKEEDNG